MQEQAIHHLFGLDETRTRLRDAGLFSAPSIANAYQPEEPRPMTADDLLLKDRIIFIEGVIHDGLAHKIIMLLLFLQSEDPNKDISLYINSEGGVVTAGMAIYDTMQFVKPDVSTICVGKAMSMGAFLLAAGAHGKRFCLPHSTMMIHQPLIPPGGLGGQASDIDIEAHEIVRMRQQLNELLAKHTRQPLERIIQDTDRDNFISAERAVEYGLVDDVISPS